MSRSLIASLILHGLIILLVVVQLPHCSRKLDFQDPGVVVEVIEDNSEELKRIAEKKAAEKRAAARKLAAKKAAEKRAAAKKLAAQKAAQAKALAAKRAAEAKAAAAKKAAQVKAAAVKAAAVKKAADAKAAQQKAIADKAAAAKKAAQVKAAADKKAADAKAAQQKALLKNKDPSKDKKDDDFDDIAKAIQAAKDKQKLAAAKSGSESALTAAEHKKLMDSLQRCWNYPVGAKGADDMRVQVEVEMNPDRTVKSYKTMGSMFASSNPFYRAAEESAIRTLSNPECSPLDLPPMKYNVWKHMIIEFDPSLMVGS